MSSTRRDFLQSSATAAAAITIGPLTRHAVAEPATPAAAPNERIKARPVHLSKVRLTGGPLKAAQDADAKYLLALEPDRMMVYYRTRAGLPAKNGAQPYAGWDGAGRNLTGHIAGHYLSAVSLMYLATGDAKFKQRADYLVNELAEVQAKNGDGYLSALENGREAFGALSRGEIRSAAFDLNGLWSPWYTLHKTFAGLRDAYRDTGNKRALEVETKFAGWAERTLAPLNADQLARMLNTEHGGMNEVLADLSVDTGDKRWLELSYKFEHHAFTDALKRHQDNLPGKHGNCQIPKLIGSAARYGYVGDPADLTAAAFFWDRVAQHHSYATGGHGLAEYFGFPDVLSPRVDGRTCESCNVYNMLKLTRQLFSFRPDAYYADFLERALFNHALASFDPQEIRSSYMVPVGRAEQQEYQEMQRSFTCCVGTGMENHALHGDGIYYESDDTVWVNLFAPSTAELSSGVRLAMDSSFPEGDRAKLTVTAPRQREFTLAVRRPSWSGDGFTMTVNGERVVVASASSFRVGGAGGRDVGFDDSVPPASSFVEVRRAWKTGDVVEITIPKSVRLEPTPDDRSVAAIMWGPLVLAGDLGPRHEGRGESTIKAPVLVTPSRAAAEWVKPSGADFSAVGVSRMLDTPSALPADVKLTPFYRTHRRTYSVYFDVLAPAEYDARIADAAAVRDKTRALEAATVAFVQVGDAQSEQRFNYRSEPADRQVVRQAGRSGRGGPGWFSYDLPAESERALALVVTYYNDLGLPVFADFDISVNGKSVAHYAPNRAANAFWDARYELGAVADKTVGVRFNAAQGGRIASVFGVRLVRA
jgi:DUF1680 family protein